MMPLNLNLSWHDLISSCIESAVSGSSPVVGSSKNIISGAWISALASAARLTIPPESCAGYFSPTRQAPPARERRAPWARISSSLKPRLLPQRKRDVVIDRHRAEERAALEEKAELLPQFLELLAAEPRYVARVEVDLAPVGLQEARHALQKHALPLRRCRR